MARKLSGLMVVVLVFVLASPAHAQSSAGAGVGFWTASPESGGSKTFTQFNFPANFKVWKLGIGLNATINYDTDKGEIRKEDWDEDADYLKLVKYLEWGQRGDFLHFRVGELFDYNLGHGSIVRHFYSATDIDSRKVGGVFDMDLGKFGFETFGNNMARGEVLGGRFFWRPLREMGLPIIGGLALGGSYALDRSASFIAAGPGLGEVSAIGGDVELPLLKTSMLDIIPYADYVMLQSDLGSSSVDHGAGLYAGVENRLKLPIGLVSDLVLRFEYRSLDPDHLPAYFNALYEKERRDYSYRDATPTRAVDANLPQPPAPGAPRPAYSKGDVLRALTKAHSASPLEKLVGWFGELSWESQGLFVLAGGYESYGDRNNGQLNVRLEVKPVAGHQVAWHYYKRGVRSLSDAGTLDDRSQMDTTVFYQANPFLYVNVTYHREWQFNKATNRYDAVDSYTPGLTMMWQW